MGSIASVLRWFNASVLARFSRNPDQKIQAALYKAAHREGWYLPWPDKLSPDCIRLLSSCLESLVALRGLLPQDLARSPGELAKAWCMRCAESLADKSGIAMSDLSLEGVRNAAPAEVRNDFIHLQSLFSQRLQKLDKRRLSAYQTGLQQALLLVQALTLDTPGFSELRVLFPERIAKAAASMHLEGLEDLHAVLTGLKIGPELELVWTQVLGFKDFEPCRELSRMAKDLTDEAVLPLVIQAMRGSRELPRPETVLAVPDIAAVFKAMAVDFDTDLVKAREAWEQSLLRTRTRELFGEQHLVDCPLFNSSTNTLLMEKRLPKLRYHSVVKILLSFVRCFHNSLFNPVFQKFGMEVDFAPGGNKELYTKAVDKYYLMVQAVEKFAADQESASFSQMRQVEELLRLPLLQAPQKSLIAKIVESTNEWATRLCVESVEALRTLADIADLIDGDLESNSSRFILNSGMLKGGQESLVVDLHTVHEKTAGLLVILESLVMMPDQGRPAP